MEDGAVRGHDENAVVVVDPSGTIRYWSPGAADLFGHTAEDAVGKTLDIIVPADFREVHWAGFHRAMASGHAKSSGEPLNLPVNCADGDVRAFPGTFMLVTDAHGRATGAIAVWSDACGDELPFSAVLPLDR